MKNHDDKTTTVHRIYQRIAGIYDGWLQWLYLIGFRHHRYRQAAVQALHLSSGATVLDVGCGTGLNFSLLHEAVGPTGHIIGVDLTDEMLDQARARIQQHGWTNVTLLSGDATTTDLPSGVDAALATFSLSMMPSYATVVDRMVAALRPSGHLAVLDFRTPSWWPRWLARMAVRLIHSLGETRTMAERPVWEAVQAALDEVSMQTFYFDAAYVVSGQRPAQPNPTQR